MTHAARLVKACVLTPLLRGEYFSCNEAGLRGGFAMRAPCPHVWINVTPQGSNK